MGIPEHFHGYMKLCQNPHTFLGLKGYKMNHEKLLLKNSFPKNNKEKNFINRFNARTTLYTCFREYVLTIYASSTLLIPSTHHLIFKYRASKTQKILFTSPFYLSVETNFFFYFPYITPDHNIFSREKILFISCNYPTRGWWSVPPIDAFYHRLSLMLLY